MMWLTLLRRTVPSAVTLAGLACSLVGAVLGLWWLVGVGLACDAVDGRLARALDGVTTGGAELDWHTDVGVAHVLAWTCWPGFAVWCSAGLILWQAACRTRAIRSSGRAYVAAVAMAWMVLT